MSSPRVALVGATGTLGPSIFNALVSASFPLTILTRIGGGSKITPPPGSNAAIKVKAVDYTSHRSLVEALSDVDVVVCTLGSQDLFKTQKSLIDASIEAGVKRFLPSEYGNGANDKVRRFPLLWADKDKTQSYLEHQAAAHFPDFTYSIINTGSFFDWQLELGFIVNLKEHTATVYDGGDVLNSVTTLGTIAKAVISVILHTEETKNRHVFVHDAAVTQNQLIRIAKKIDGKEWRTTPMSTDDVEKSAYKAVDQGDDMTAMLGFIARSCWGPGFGQDFTKKLDNAMLGLPVMRDDDVEDLMRGIMAKF